MQDNLTGGAMKTRKLYQVRFFNGNGYSKQIGHKLVERGRATKIVKFLKRHRVEAFCAPLVISK